MLIEEAVERHAELAKFLEKAVPEPCSRLRKLGFDKYRFTPYYSYR